MTERIADQFRLPRDRGHPHGATAPPAGHAAAGVAQEGDGTSTGVRSSRFREERRAESEVRTTASSFLCLGGGCARSQAGDPSLEAW